MKKSVFFFNLTVIATFFVLFFSTGTHADCTKDIDCKGNRICEKGICVDPGQTEHETIAAKKQNEYDAWLKKLDGRRYTFPVKGGINVLDVRGKVLVSGVITNGLGYLENNRFEIRGRETTVTDNAYHAPQEGTYIMERTLIISEDSDRITMRAQYTDGVVRDFIYHWQR
jgi:hypothetical protein